MNRQEMDILNALAVKPYMNQRILAESCGHSLGIVNRSVKNLIREHYLDDDFCLTEKAKRELRDKAPKNAIILAAGFGMRMVPINMETPKALLEVGGEPLIERLIKQLQEVGIREIYVVVGFLKEQLEYLIDEYGVELVVNEEYAEKNNLHSLKLVLNHLSNTYIIPCDIWCSYNPFNRNELYSWYMVSDLVDDNSSVRTNRKMELVSVSALEGGNTMVGICYLIEEQAAVVRQRIQQMDQSPKNNTKFWEEALYDNGRMILQARVVHSSEVVEINTYEQLRELDSDSNHLKSDTLAVIEEVLDVRNDEIKDITVLKKGMTNRSFLFTSRGKKYIMRIPGEGTDQLINRVQEASVYHEIVGKSLCDDVIYINPQNGYKITRFVEGARVCDPFNTKDVADCMKRLRAFHELELYVDHEFDIYEHIEFYESLWQGQPSVYKDYQKTKEKVLSLKSYIDGHIEKKVLTHIDAVPDNFLIVENEKGESDIRLIDWEYAGMQDPHVDLAMFCIYAMYNRNQVDQLIEMYFEEGCPKNIRIKIYCYIAVCGLLWSNWCEYKRNLGVEFGEYSLRQYRFAKDYYKIVQEELAERKDD